jgi:hypothetical protein
MPRGQRRGSRVLRLVEGGAADSRLGRDGELVAINFRVPERVRKQLRQLSVDTDRTMSELFVMALEAYTRERASGRDDLADRSRS